MKEDKLLYLIELLMFSGFEMEIKPCAQHSGFRVRITRNGVSYEGTSGASYVGVFKAIDSVAREAIRGSE